MSSEEKEEKAVAAPTGKDAAKQKLKRILVIVVSGLSPVLALFAIGVAVYALSGSRTERTQTEKYASAIEATNAGLAASRQELDKLKLSAAALARENAELTDKLKKQEALLARVVQNITPVQARLKMAPTLESQLQQLASGVASVPVPSAEAGAARDGKKKLQMSAQEPAAQQHSVKHPAAANKSQKPFKPERELSPEAKAMKEAIERFNQQK